MIVQSVVTKKQVNNIYDFMEFHETIHQINTGEKNPLRGNYTADIETYLKKHYTEDRVWKYNAETRELRPVQELIDQRERAVITNYRQDKAAVDEQIIIRAREVEKRMKRLKMAKYSEELFDEIIEEMTKEKRVVMEMMAELDVDE